jgi:hypothetical protein
MSDVSKSSVVLDLELAGVTLFSNGHTDPNEVTIDFKRGAEFQSTSGAFPAD